MCHRYRQFQPLMPQPSLLSPTIRRLCSDTTSSSSSGTVHRFIVSGPERVSFLSHTHTPIVCMVYSFPLQATMKRSPTKRSGRQDSILSFTLSSASTCYSLLATHSLIFPPARSHQDLPVKAAICIDFGSTNTRLAVVEGSDQVSRVSLGVYVSGGDKDGIRSRICSCNHRSG